jgi:hypothetical protein
MAVVCAAAVQAAPVRMVRLVEPQPGSLLELRAEIDAAVHAELMTATLARVELPLPGRDAVTLEMTAGRLDGTGTRFIVVDEDGEREVPAPAFRSFRGRVAGEPDSRAVLNLFGGSAAGFVRVGGEEFSVAPLESGAGGELAIRSAEADPDQPDSPFCPVELPHKADAPQSDAPQPALGGDPPIDGTTVLTAEVAIDATYQWSQYFISPEAAQAYIMNLMAQVSTIFEDEVNVEIVVPYLRVFSTPDDPYTDTTNTGTLLADLRSEWNANQTGVDRTVVHLFSRRSSGGAGIAYIDVLCSNDQQPGNSYDYGVSTLSASGGSWERRLVAHELGHNFASPHTHCYLPPIDTCANENGCYEGPTSQTVGTIMSYCSSATSVFHARVESETVRPAAEQAYPTCMSLSVPLEVPLAPEGLYPF